MKFTIASSLLALVTVATALATSQEDIVDFAAYPWKAPGPDDSRGPCPGLNTLANHGFLPRNGRNITVPMIVKAGFDAYNLEGETLIIAGKIGMLTSREADSLSLEDLKLHGNIEHDASVSREDFAIGDNLHFNETIFTTLANSNPGSNVYNVTSAAQVQRDRLTDSLARNPTAKNTQLQISIRSAESALYLSVMGNVLRGEAPKKFVNVLFREERLPVAEGWKRSTISIGNDQLKAMAAKIVEVSDWEPTGDNCPAIVVTPPGL